MKIQTFLLFIICFLSAPSWSVSCFRATQDSFHKKETQWGEPIEVDIQNVEEFFSDISLLDQVIKLNYTELGAPIEYVGRIVQIIGKEKHKRKLVLLNEKGNLLDFRIENGMMAHISINLLNNAPNSRKRLYQLMDLPYISKADEREYRELTSSWREVSWGNFINHHSYFENRPAYLSVKAGGSYVYAIGKAVEISEKSIIFLNDSGKVSRIDLKDLDFIRFEALTLQEKVEKYFEVSGEEVGIIAPLKNLKGIGKVDFTKEIPLMGSGDGFIQNSTTHVGGEFLFQFVDNSLDLSFWVRGKLRTTPLISLLNSRREGTFVVETENGIIQDFPVTRVKKIIKISE